MDPKNPFYLLAPLVQKWVYKQRWSDLRDIQKAAIPVVLQQKSDVIISASTAAGKTEAAFLPACSAIANQRTGIGILYISPLKALINDQYRRLESLCDLLQLPLTPWHGDIAQSIKRKCKVKPAGILLITPESLEALMVRESGWLALLADSLQYIIIDEYHAFLGSERGCQLQSLMHRLEHLRQKDGFIPRIALSATLGDMEQVRRSLRPPYAQIRNELIQSNKNHGRVRLQIRGYYEPSRIEKNNKENKNNNITPPGDKEIAHELYTLLRGDSHLIFANSRGRTERFAALLADICKKNIVPNEFFPHHGSLSKELRTELERRLQKEHLPTTAICTMTLELGIDIGKVNSVAQVTAPHSVASLRQRLGRSGRRDNTAVLRMFILEKEVEKNSHMSDLLRLQLLQSIAIIRLLLKKWYEPANITQLHLSTLVHQILSVIAQWGGVRVEQLWHLFCVTGSFYQVSIDCFKRLLRQMGKEKLLFQLNDGQLVLGENGERLTGHYSFYAVFNTPEEYRIEYKGKTLGSFPIEYPVVVDQNIIFGGKRWRVSQVDSEKKVIRVSKAKGGQPPLFSGVGIYIHDKVRKEMFEIYSNGEYQIVKGDSRIDYLDSKAKKLFQEGRDFFKNAGLDKSPFFAHGDTIYILPWLGDKIVNTLATMLVGQGFRVTNSSGILEIQGTSINEICSVFNRILTSPQQTPEKLARCVPEKKTEKFDQFLSEQLLCETYAAKAFDIDGAYQWMRQVLA
ncbi:DEAD/DEAH box helicase [Candidatus Electrothrix sp.]|uniref:DEAD/DEAH box helicase n=1 Tax=Candidatus Electrothrix sp. TaxID=2170559 RepID=UPI00405724A2